MLVLIKKARQARKVVRNIGQPRAAANCRPAKSGRNLNTYLSGANAHLSGLPDVGMQSQFRVTKSFLLVSAV